jgi:hypothetical protein
MDLVKIKNDIENKKNKKEKEVKEERFIEKVIQEVEKVDKEEITETRKPEHKLTPRIISLDIEYETPTGQKKSCKLTSKVMDSAARMKYEKILATLASGYVFEQLPVEIQNRYAALARIVAQTIDTPDWLLEVCGEDLDFAYSLTLQLLEHEKRFFRYTALASAETAPRPRFSINSASFE